jgi:transcriptional regulator with XRE-family HTH domain
VKIDYFSSTQEVLKEIGRRIKKTRIAMSVTQEEMAERTGLSKRTISNLETGKDVSLSTLIDILRAENLLQNMDLITPDEGIRPSQIVALGKMRERVRKGKQPGTGQTEWKWGDEQ